MTDEIETADESALEETPQGPMCGERLAEARRELQISVLEIAKELHLDDFKVRAIENNEFDVLGAPVFAKGHLRKYAQLVRVEEADVLADYYHIERASGAPSLLPGHHKPERSISLGPWIATIVVIAIAATVYWWFTTKDQTIAPEPLTPAATSEVVVDDSDIAVDLPTTTSEDAAASDSVVLDELPVNVSSDVSSDEIEETAASDVPESAPLQGIDSALPQVLLNVTYSGDCWTEITDAAGRRLFFALGREGRSVDVRGEAPINVLLGDADNVSLSVDGESYPISEGERRGQTARLTITGS